MQRAGPDHVRFGSEADIEVRRPDVRLTPESGHCLARSGCLLWATFGSLPQADESG